MKNICLMNLITRIKQYNILKIILWKVKYCFLFFYIKTRTFNSSSLLSIWCRKQDLNPQPTDYKSVALPIELFRHILVPVVGVEPTRYRYHWILSPARLPIPPYRQVQKNYITKSLEFILFFYKK